jgi:hypothetical protein
MRGAVEGRADWLAGRLSDQLENVVRSLLPLISKRLMACRDLGRSSGSR